MTDSTDRMRSPLCLHTARPRARRAPSTMLSPACWHHSMHCRMRPRAGLEAQASLLTGEQNPKHLSPALQPWSVQHPEGSHNPITSGIIRS